MTGIKWIAVKNYKDMANIVDFQSLHQGKEESVSRFSAHLDSKGNTYDFSISCTHGVKILYREKIKFF